MAILTEFVGSSIPNWPGNLTLHQFVQHMTLDHVDLVRNRVLANHQVLYRVAIQSLGHKLTALFEKVATVDAVK